MSFVVRAKWFILWGAWMRSADFIDFIDIVFFLTLFHWASVDQAEIKDVVQKKGRRFIRSHPLATKNIHMSYRSNLLKLHKMSFSPPKCRKEGQILSSPFCWRWRNVIESYNPSHSCYLLRWRPLSLLKKKKEPLCWINMINALMNGREKCDVIEIQRMRRRTESLGGGEGGCSNVSALVCLWLLRYHCLYCPRSASCPFFAPLPDSQLWFTSPHPTYTNCMSWIFICLSA